MIVCINTYQRPRQVRSLMENYSFLKSCTFLFLREDDPYIEEYSKIAKDLYFPPVIVKCKKVKCQKQIILNFCEKEKIDRPIIMDDDVRFETRRLDNPKKTLKSTNEQLQKHFFEMQRLCSYEYPLIHPIMKVFSTKFMSFPYQKNIQAIRCVCPYIPYVTEKNIRYDVMVAPYLSDRYFQLSILSTGKRSIAMTDFNVDDYGKNAKGGCSVNRTVEGQNLSAIELRDEFPDYVSLREKLSCPWKEKTLVLKISFKRFLETNEKRGVESLYLNLNNRSCNESQTII